MKTKTGEMGAQSKECQGLLAATRSSERGLILQWILPYSLWGWNGPADTLIRTSGLQKGESINFCF